MIHRSRRGWVGFAVVLALGIGGGVAWNNGLKDRWIPKRFGVVSESDRLYRSGRIHPALLEEVLARYGIQVVVDLTDPEKDGSAQQDERRIVESLKIRWLNFPLNGDGTGRVESYVSAVALMVQARSEGQPLLVHCAAGAQRTGGAVAFYRVLVEGRAPAVAVAELKRYGWQPDKDRELIDYLNANMAFVAARLYAMRAIASLPDPLPRF